MKWRSLLVGGLISVLASVLAGLIVWLFTREPRRPVEAERLRYTVEEVASFSPGQTKVGIVTVKLMNLGNRAARDVRAKFVLPESAEITAKQIYMSSGPAGAFKEENDDSHTLSLDLASLAPLESLTASLLVQGTGSFKAKGGLRSADSVGEEGDDKAVSANEIEVSQSWWLPPLIKLAPILPALGIMITFVFAQKRLRTAFSTIFPSVNDTAFVYLQQKMVAEARDMLMKKAEVRGSGPFETANLALAVGLGGQAEEAERLFRIAEWWAETAHSKAVVAYNRATLLVAAGRDEAAKAKLREAVALSPAAVRRYFRLSQYFAEASNRDSSFGQIASGAEP